MKQVVAFNQGILAGLTTRKAGAAVTRLLGDWARWTRHFGFEYSQVETLNKNTWQLLQSSNLWVGFWMLQEIKVCYLTFHASQMVGRRNVFSLMQYIQYIVTWQMDHPLTEVALWMTHFKPLHRGEWCFWIVFVCDDHCSGVGKAIRVSMQFGKIVQLQVPPKLSILFIFEQDKYALSFVIKSPA